jgi:hypothetical protein
MKIACLGWGSLLWKPGPLQLKSQWAEEGPWLPIEFCRVGDGGELATALCPGAQLVKTWCAVLSTEDINDAREQLRLREAVDPAHPEWIGSVPPGEAALGASQIGDWVRGSRYDAVVWTALPPRFDGVEGQIPSANQAVDYLQSLQKPKREHAEDYVRRVPSSIDTLVRREIIRVLGWTSV